MGGMQGFQAKLSEALRLTIIYRLAHELNADLTSTDVLRSVLHAAAEALATPHASIVALREGELRAAYALGKGKGTDPVPVMTRVLREGVAGFVLHNYGTVIINDITNNPLWLSLPGESLSPQAGSALCVPLIHAGDVVGVITLAHPMPSYFTADAVNLTNTISEIGASALTNALRLEETRQASQRFRALFDDAIVPIIITDLQGNIRNVNQRTCEFLGYVREELLHQNITTLHQMGAGPISADRFDHLKRGLDVSFQSAILTKDNREQPVQVYAKRIGEGDENDQIQWIEHDIVPQLALEQLRQDLSAMVYHDMRGPLGNVHASLQALKRMLGDHPNPNVTTLLSLADRSERQARRMIDSLLDVYRLEAGNKLLARTNAALSAVIQAAIDPMQPIAEEKHIQMQLALADDLPLLCIDAEMIERVIANLTDNAIKYSPEHGLVTISTATSGSEVFIRIKDYGPGIPPEAQQVIFDKFSRVKQQHTHRGVGLGLAFCRLAVEAHGGRIWVKSNNGHGSTFTFALPVEAPSTQELPGFGAAVAQQEAG